MAFCYGTPSRREVYSGMLLSVFMCCIFISTNFFGQGSSFFTQVWVGAMPFCVVGFCRATWGEGLKTHLEDCFHYEMRSFEPEASYNSLWCSLHATTTTRERKPHVKWPNNSSLAFSLFLSCLFFGWALASLMGISRDFAFNTWRTKYYCHTRSLKILNKPWNRESISK